MAKLIGTGVSQVPTNGDLGKLAFQEPEAVNITGGTIDGASIGGSSAAAITGTTITGTSFVSSGDMTFGDNDKAIFGAGSDLQIYHDGSHSYIHDNGTGDLFIRGSSNVYIQNSGGGSSGAQFVAGGAANINYAGATKLATTSTGIDVTGNVVSDGASLDGAVVINESGADVDFRIESDTNQYALFVDAGNSAVKINTSATNDDPLTIQANTGADAIRIIGRASGNASRIDFYEDTNTSRQLVLSSESLANYIVSEGTIPFQIYTNAVKRMEIDGSGNIVFNETGADADFRVESDSNTHALFVNAGNSRVGINDGGPESTLHVRSSGTAGLDFTQALTVEGYGTGNTGDAACIAFAAGDATRKGAITFTRNNSYGRGYMSFLVDGAADSNPPTASEEVMRINSNSVVINENSNDMDFRVESDTNTHALFVDASDNTVNFFVGAGVSSSDVSGHGTTIRDGTITMTANNANPHIIVNKTSGSTGTVAQFLVSGNNKGSITIDGTGTTYNTTSDRRLKDNIQTITDGTDKLMAMNPVTHTWKADPDAPAVHGFIAQEMQDVIPEAISGEDGGDEMMSMDYGRITPVIVAALQDAHREIQNLKAEIAALKEK
jgi:hypothetical protein